MFYCDKEIPGCRESTRQIAFHGRGGLRIFSGTTVSQCNYTTHLV